MWWLTWLRHMVMVVLSVDCCHPCLHIWQELAVKCTVGKETRQYSNESLLRYIRNCHAKSWEKKLKWALWNHQQVNYLSVLITKWDLIQVFHTNFWLVLNYIEHLGVRRVNSNGNLFPILQREANITVTTFMTSLAVTNARHSWWHS